MSIRLRLTLWYAFAIASTILLLCGGLWLALEQSILHTLDQDLRSRLTAVQRYLEKQRTEGETSSLQQEMAEDFDAVEGTALVRVASPTGGWIYCSSGARGWGFAAPRAETLPARGTIETIVIGGHSTRILSAPVSVGVAQLGLPLAPFQRMQRLLAWTVVLGSPLLIVLASAGGYWISGRALKPVHQLAIKARNIGAKNLSERLPNRGTGDELDQLADVLNRMLTRLESAFLRMTRFTSDASHELRTPVAIMNTTAEVALLRPVPIGDNDRAWGVILKQAGRVQQLIEDLLLLARADSEAEPIPCELMDASTVIHEACEEMRVLADAAGLGLYERIASDCTMFGDPEDLRRMILILIDNAIKYTRSPGEVFVSAKREGSGVEDEVLTVTVRDTGIGISEADLAHVFDRFYRVSQDRSRSTGGAGLGLAIAQHLAERHGGEITARSVPREGSTFTVVLPFRSS